MVTNARYDKKGNLMSDEFISVCVLNNKQNENIPYGKADLRYDKQTYIKNGNGVFDGIRLIIHDKDNDNTYDDGEPIELVLCGA